MNDETTRIQVLCVDDHPLVLSALQQVIQRTVDRTRATLGVARLSAAARTTWESLVVGFTARAWSPGDSLTEQTVQLNPLWIVLAMVGARAAGRPMALDERFVAAWGRILDDAGLDGSLKALMLTLPDERVLGQAMDEVDVEGIHAAREHVRRALADAYAPTLARSYAEADPGAYRLDREAIAARRLRATLLGLLGEQSDAEGRARAVALARAQLQGADNMTDAEAALACLVDAGGDAREEALASF